MKIEDLFKNELSNDKIETPQGLWERLESGLEAQLPQSTMSETASVQTVVKGAKTLSTIGKIVAAVTSCAIAAAAGYYLLTDQETPQKLRQIETPKPPITLPKEETQEPQNSFPVLENQNSLSENQSAVSLAQNSHSVEPLQDTVKQSVVSEPQTTFFVEPTPAVVEVSPEKEVVSGQAEPQSQPQQEEITKVEIVEQAPEIEILIPNVITPNGDGINDLFEIHKLENYPDNQLIIYDRRGKVLFSVRNYRNDWTAEGLPNGTYFYQLSVKLGSNSKIFKGSITLLR